MLLLAVAVTVCVLTALLVWYFMRDDEEFSKYGYTIVKPQHPKLFYLKFLRVFYNLIKHQSYVCALMQCISAITEGARGYKLLRFDLLNLKIFFFQTPETVEVLLNNSSAIDKADLYRFIHPWLGLGLLTSSGDRWRHRRKQLTPAFHFNILEEFVPVFNEQSAILVSKLQRLQQDQPYVDISPLLLKCTLDIICETAMGVHTNAQGGESDCLDAIKEASSVFYYRVVRPWLHSDFIFRRSPYGRKFYKSVRTIQDFNWKVLKQKKEEMLSKGIDKIKEERRETEGNLYKRKRKAFLEMLLEYHFADPSLTEENIADEVHTFMFEGHDTTAMGISWAIYFLGLNQTVQQKVFDELDDIFGDDIDRDVTREDLTRMKYLECVIKETLRLHPSVPIFGREIKEPIKIDNYTIDKGSTGVVFVWGIHRDPAYFKNPEKFIPERFLPENYVGKHPYAYIPFSAGPRNCIGQKFALMEEKTVLSHIFRRFKAQSLDQRDQITVERSIITKNVGPLRIQFSPRFKDLN